MTFTSLQTIVLGDDPDRALQATAIILRLGFPRGMIAICKQCNRVEEFTLDEAARHTVNGTWPRCHDKRMVMEDANNAPSF